MQSASSTSDSPLPMDYGAQERKIEEQIDESLQKQEISKLRNTFQAQLKDHYISRKSKEYLNMHCSSHCFNKEKGKVEKPYDHDEMTRFEKSCMISCLHKSYRYLAHANSIFSVLSANQDNQKDILDQFKEDINEEPTYQEAVMAAMAKRE